MADQPQYKAHEGKHAREGANQDFDRTKSVLESLPPGNEKDPNEEFTLDSLTKENWDTSRDAISRVEWVHHSELEANSYNPNVVFKAELKLLERSILRTSWVQPILVSRSGRIIDGFHRASLSRESAKLNARYKGMVPIVRMDVDDAEAIILTVRMNRAKGTHVAVRMADLVKELVDVHGKTLEEIGPEMGMTQAEVKLLYQNDTYQEKKLAEFPYSNAWVPKESKISGDLEQTAPLLSKKLKHRPYEEVPPDFERPMPKSFGDDEDFDEESVVDDELKPREGPEDSGQGRLQ